MITSLEKKIPYEYREKYGGDELIRFYQSWQLYAFHEKKRKYNGLPFSPICDAAKQEIMICVCFWY